MTSRTRLTDESTTIGTYNHLKPGDVIYFSHDNIVSSSSKLCVDVSTPNFHKLRKAGKIINNPCSIRHERRDKIGGYSYDYQGWSASGDGSQTLSFMELYGGTWLSIPDSGPDKLATVKAKALAGMDPSNVDLMEDLFEIKETIRFLRNPTKALLDISKAFKKSKQKRLKQLDNQADALSGAWLQYRFALSPLVRTIDDIVKELISSKKRRGSRLTSRAFDSYTDYDSDINVAAVFTYDRSVSLTINYSAGILYEVSDYTQDWRQRFGLRFKDVPKTLWAVFPYSFMVDRVSNISDTIAGLTNLSDPSITVLAGWTTKRTETVNTVQCISQTNYPAVSCLSDTIADTVFSYSRDPWTPSAVDTLPSFELEGLVDSATKITDLLALIKQNLK